MRRATILVMLTCVALALACQKPASRDADAAAAPSGPASACTQLGAPCTFAPGKLGTCVEVERPSGPSAFVCQSQH